MAFKESLFTKVFTIRNLFIGGNILLLLLFLAALAQDHFREWKPYQKEFKKREIQRAEAELAKAVSPEDRERLDRELQRLQRMPLEIKQVMVKPLNRVDRCLTCHLGMESQVNPAMVTSYEDHPFVARENAIHKAHPVEQFGCAVCHGGQGLATEVKAAHGEVKHWEKPLLRGAYLQASCAKCHANVNDAKAMPMTTAWRRGEKLFRDLGCIGCHQVRGEGGPVSVDLAEETADKPLSRIDFSHTGLPKHERTLANWIKLHFIKDPQELVPGDPEGKYNDEPIAPSGMPFFNLSEEDAEALTVLVLGMTRESVPKDYYVPSPPRPEPKFATAVQRGRYSYEKHGCAACHGADAKGGIRNFNYENDVEPDLTKSAATFTREELKEKIVKGVPVVGKKDPKGATPPLYMPAWGAKIQGQELEDLVTYLLSIAEKTETW
jgi:mono/diheme cytochrome c family protein/nitrate reductase cytochrome c-type subunit